MFTKLINIFGTVHTMFTCYDTVHTHIDKVHTHFGTVHTMFTCYDTVHTHFAKVTHTLAQFTQCSHAMTQFTHTLHCVFTKLIKKVMCGCVYNIVSLVKGFVLPLAIWFPISATQKQLKQHISYYDYQCSQRPQNRFFE